MQSKQPGIKLYLTGVCCPDLRSTCCIASAVCEHLTAELRLDLETGSARINGRTSTGCQVCECWRPEGG